ncbi:hypothetical protein C0584_00240 [Candidatus Parcubacteria bacterium]|nr:MAG: hypothetical protein C0584_00240 [Candidatus Parcubacteria bacterium]
MKKRFFIVEDDVNILYAVQAQLRVKGFDAFVDNGAHGIETLIDSMETEQPDFIILDLILPHIDGFELLSSIKANNMISSIPVFVFTNLSDEDTKTIVEKMGVDYHFIKSEMNVEEFVRKVVKIIHNKSKLQML